jgi:hypothetical protein
VTIAADIATVIETICPRVFPIVAPTSTVRPYVTYQFIGGDVLNPLDNSIPGKRNVTVQVNVWAATHKSVNDLIGQIEDVMRAMPARPASAAFTDYDNDMEVYSAQQEFNLWR